MEDTEDTEENFGEADSGDKVVAVLTAMTVIPTLTLHLLHTLTLALTLTLTFSLTLTLGSNGSIR